MPAIEKTSVLARVRQTSMSDLIRLRLASGVSDTTVIQASNLDAPTRELVASICKKTKLWPGERADVARELVAHFQDGIESGQQPGELIKSFGDAAQAAKLIRRAKIRNRSGLWHFKRLCLWALGVFALLYLGLAIYFVSGKPTLSTDYVAKINARVGTVPESERAWPVYRDLAAALKADPALDPKTDLGFYGLGPTQTARRWEKVSAWLKANPQMLALADQATSKPRMGFIYGSNGTAKEFFDSRNQSAPDPNAPFFNSVTSLLLPQLTKMRTVAEMIAGDARLAAEEGDAQRWMKRIEQLRVVADQSREPGFLINYLVMIGIEAMRLTQIERMLVERPNLLSDDQLAELAHRNAWYRGKSDLINYELERMGFADVIQRIYTDDGHGDGRISPRGLNNFHLISNPNDTQGLFPSGGNYAIELTKVALSPAAVLVMASRKEMTDKYNAYMDRSEARLHRPWHQYVNDPLFVEIQGINRSTRDSLKYALLNMLMPSLDRSNVTAERLATHRDAMQIAIALELFKRRTGNYPNNLSDLSPRLLPAVPADPCDGLPMRYKLVDGKPLVYSIGVDLDDDGGTFPTVRTGQAAQPAPHQYSLAIGESAHRCDGDWILYPLPQWTLADDSYDGETDADDNQSPATAPAE